MLKYESYDINLPLTSDTTKECLGEIAEIGFDSWLSHIASITDLDIVDQIPVIKTAKALYSIGNDIRERHLLKQTLNFFSAFLKDDLDSDKLESYRSKILSTDNYLQDETDRILLILQMSLDRKKAELLGSLYREYVFEEINNSEFMVISNAIYTMFIDDIDILKKYNVDEDYNESLPNDVPSLSRLQSLGLIHLNFKGTPIGNNTTSSYYVVVNKLGKILSEL